MSIIKQLKIFFKDSNYNFVIIFGSYSNNSYTESSDIDIGVFFRDKIDYMALGYQTAMLESKLKKKVDIIVLNNIYKKDPLFAFEILQNHKPIIINNEDSFISFKTSSQLYYLDYKPLIDMNKRALLNRIKNNQIGERSFVGES